MNNNYSKIFKLCKSCYNTDHLVKECPLVHYAPSAEFLIDKYNFSQSQERSVFDRIGLRTNSRKNNRKFKNDAYKYQKKLIVENYKNLIDRYRKTSSSEYSQQSNEDEEIDVVLKIHDNYIKKPCSFNQESKTDLKKNRNSIFRNDNSFNKLNGNVINRTSILNESYGLYKKNSDTTAITSIIEEKFKYGKKSIYREEMMESIKNWENYHPEGNIEKIVKEHERFL